MRAAAVLGALAAEHARAVGAQQQAVVLPGIMSSLPESAGTQKLCSTSFERSRTSTVRPTGMRSSLAVAKSTAPVSSR